MIVVVGLSHRTAPIAVREKLALVDDDVAELVGQLVARPEVSEAFAVSTCNRVELVVAGKDASVESLEAAAHACRDALIQRLAEVDKYLYVHVGGRAVRHLFRVASSLDSLVLGEPQIFGQLKQGFERGRRQGTVGPVLHRTFPRAARAAKRVRTETAIGAGQVSVPSVAIDLAQQIFGDLAGRTVLLVGSGEMGCTVARLLRDAGTRLLVLGRTPERVQAVAREVGGEALLLDRLGESLARADVVVTSTSSPESVIQRDLVQAQRKIRRGRNLFLIDLAVPRDVDPDVGELDGVFLYNIDDLSHVVAESFEGRRREAEQAERILEEETRGYERWAEAEQATPTIKALRARLRASLEVELERSLRGRLKDLDGEQRRAVAKMLDASLNRMLHLPTVRLREGAASSDDSSLDGVSSMLDELFQLSDVAAESLDVSSVRLPGSPPPGEREESGQRRREDVGLDPIAAPARVRPISSSPPPNTGAFSGRPRR